MPLELVEMEMREEPELSNQVTYGAFQSILRSMDEIKEQTNDRFDRLEADNRERFERQNQDTNSQKVTLGLLQDKLNKLTEELAREDGIKSERQKIHEKNTKDIEEIRQKIARAEGAASERTKLMAVVSGIISLIISGIAAFLRK